MPKKKSPNVTLGKIFKTYYNVTFTSKVARLPRCYYWIFSFLNPILIGCGINGGMAAMQWSYSNNLTMSIFMFIISLIILFVALLSGIRSDIARAHDTDHSGFFLFWSLVPYLGGIILFIVLGFYGSIQGKNEYGKPFDFDKLESLPPKK